MGLSELWGKIKKTDSYRPARIIIPSKNVSPALKIAGPFERNKQYFEVTVNEMYLTYERKWFKTWEPIVFSTSKFLYDGTFQEVPFFVGQNMLEGKSEQLPKGMIFENTKVAGLHPYRGGDFTISIVLARAMRNNYLRKVLNLIENTSKTYLGGFGTAVLPYVNIAKVLVDSFEDLLDSGDVEPLIGHRITLSPDANDGFNPGYFALINEPEEDVEASEFFVKNSKLYHGTSENDAEPYRKDDYVLYSVMAAKSRSDVEALPYFQQFKKIQELISGMGGVIDDDQKAVISSKLFSLGDKVRMSPDLTRDQVEAQIKEFREELTKMIDARKPLAGAQGPPKDPRDDWEKDMDKKLLSFLDN